MLVQLLSTQEGSLAQVDVEELSDPALQDEQHGRLNEHGMVHPIFTLSALERQATDDPRSACGNNCQGHSIASHGFSLRRLRSANSLPPSPAMA